MMKKISLLFFGLLYGTFSSLFAENVSEENALKVATRFTQQIDDQPLEPSQSLVLAYSARPFLRTDAPNNNYYVNWDLGKKSDSSDYNGWFRLSALTLNGNSYNYQQDMVIGIKPSEGGTPDHCIVITKYHASSIGLTLETTPIQKDNFTVNVSTVVAKGSVDFNAAVSIAHLNANGEIKEIVSSNQLSLTVSMSSDLVQDLRFTNCKINESIEPGDQLCLVYKIINYMDVYSIVEGTSDLPTRIDLTEGTPYKVTWNELSDVTVFSEEGYNSNSIAAGGAFKFTIENMTDKNVVVKNGTVTLIPDAFGVYTLLNIQENIVLTLSFETVVYQVTLPIIPGFDIQAAPSYNASSVESGSDFKFTVIPYAVYENYTIRVRVNGVLLSSADGTTYIIEEVKTDQIVEVEIKIEEFPPIVSPTYRIISYVDTGAALIPANGYYANAVEEGNDFKFYVDLDYGYRNWEVTVKVDDVVLSSDSWGVYKISNIYSDKTVVITLSEVFTVTYVNAQEEIEVVAENGYNMDRVVAGSDFAFHLVSPYNEEVLAVYANGKRLVPSLSVYTIPNVQENQEITVQMIDVGNEKIPSDDVRIEVGEKKICITHPYMENIPVYITSFSGALYAVYKLNGVYTELELPAKGSYIIYFGGFSQKIIVR